MKDFALYDLENKQYYPEGELEISHEDWAFYRELDGFIPLTYKVRMTVAGGQLAIKARVCNATTWGVTYKYPDNPVATLFFDQVEGTFTSQKGEVRHLSNGRMALSIRQWHQYPSILPRELYLDDQQEGEKFETL